jgi:Ca2+-binding RTX toxin-like protein
MRLLVIALFATLLLAAPASAARFQHTGADVDFTAAPTDIVRITATGHELGEPRQLTFTRGAGGTSFTIGTGCSLFASSGIARCGVSDDTRLRFTTNEKADQIDASKTDTPEDASVPEIFDTRGGDDVLVAGPLADQVDAGAGRDSITGGPGADSLEGEAGDDLFVGLDSGDVVDGGDGVDVLDLSGETEGMSISLNESADDGPLGADANVVAVETVRGTQSADLLSGGAAADRLEGGNGDDRIDTRSGGADAVDCGPGAGDLAIVDETDSVTGCEQIDLPAPAGGGAPDTGPAGPGAVTPPALAVVDGDRDGVVAGVDCDDTRAAIRPGAREVPGNGVDEDCAGGDARAPLVSGRLSFDFTAFPNGTTRADRLIVRELQAGGRAELRCSGRCSFRKKVGKARAGTVNLRKLIRGRLRTGAVLEVRLTAPGTIGRVVRFKMRNGKPPKRTSLCLPAGGKVGRCA